MKKLCTFHATLFLLILVGCAGPRSGSTEETNSSAPEWWFNPATTETHYYAFGQAKKQNPSLAQKTATARALADISNQVKGSVTSEIRDWMQESGIGETAEALEFSESTVMAAANSLEQGYTSDKYEGMKDGTVYVRISYSKDAVEKDIFNAAKREEALYNEFKASQSFERLEEKFSK